MSNLETGRLTRVVFCGGGSGGGGEDCLEAVWVGDQAHRRLAQHFVGETCFRLKDDASMFDTPSDPDAEVGHMHAEDSCLAEGEAQAPKVNVVPLPHEPTETERRTQFAPCHLCTLVHSLCSRSRNGATTQEGPR